MRRYGYAGSGDTEWHRALSYWRKLPSEAFEVELQDEVLCCVREMGSTSADWQAAIEGDAGAAVGLALRLKTPSVITPATDMIMTLLLRSAFEDAGAALVLSTRLEQMPLPAVERARLSASWRLHNVYLAWRGRAAKSRARRRK
ncbi:hypothetical protein [Bradyrhizobium vignae]|uniref:Uncharacterized protein n=1 Tax=Bradyrhizobium vignae TaxID=1549949 RepID=A0A2U3PUL8_9BRAD|nr:hypothetical protein [Bradyrhizobium vignae]SPP92861.1 protein of unknown function [Bradyrhizobium vignae]